MKNFSKIFILSLLLSLISCQKEQDSLSKKKEKLAKYKEEMAELKTKIEKLEKEIAKADPGASSSLKAKLVSLTEVSPQDFNHYVEVQGKVDGDENVAVNPETPGTITKIYVKQGQQVRKGQVLAEIDGGAMLEGVQEVKTQLALAKTVYERQKNLWDQKIGSEIQYLNAKTNKEALERRLASMQEQYAMTKIKSPINGTVEESNVRPGSTVSPGSPMPAFRVINFKKMKVIADLAESFASKIKTGNDVIVNFPDINKEVETKLSFAAKYIDPSNRSFNVEVALDNSDPAYRANMVAILKINDFSAKDANVVPVNAVQNSDKGQYVFVAEQRGKKLIAVKKFIKTGLTYKGDIHVLEGLSTGDRIVTTGYQEIEEGQELTLN